MLSPSDISLFDDSQEASDYFRKLLPQTDLSCPGGDSNSPYSSSNSSGKVTPETALLADDDDLFVQEFSKLRSPNQKADDQNQHSSRRVRLAGSSVPDFSEGLCYPNNSKTTRKGRLMGPCSARPRGPDCSPARNGLFPVRTLKRTTDDVKALVADHMSKTSSCRRKQQFQPPTPIHQGQFFPDETYNSPAERTTGGARMENSLLVLTRKFVNVLQSKPTVNLNDAAIEMGVPKRRLYDITNVFEGIDLIHKIGKNSIAIKKGMLDPELDPSTSSSSAPSSERALKLQQLEELTQRSSDLDVMLQSLLNAVQLRKENPVDRTYTYVSHTDLRNLPGMEDKTLIAISAQWDTGFSVVKSDFSKTQRNEVKIRNDHGKPMTTLLCPNDDNGVAQHLGQDNEVAKQGYYPVTPASNPAGLDGLEPLTKRRAFEPVTPTAQGVQHQPQFAYAYEQSHQSGVPVQMQENDFVMPSSSHNMKPSDTQLITPSKVLSPGRDMGLLLPSPIKTLTDPYSSVSSMGSMGWSNDELMSAHMDMEDPYQLSSDMLLDGIYQESDAWKL